MFRSTNRKSVKVLLEEIDDAQLQLDRDEVEVKGLLNFAKSERRDFTGLENHKFNTTIRRVKETKKRLTDLQTELREAEAHEGQLRAMNTSTNKNLTLAEQDATAQGYAGGHPQNLQYAPQVRSPRLRAFKDERAVRMRAVCCSALTPRAWVAVGWIRWPKKSSVRSAWKLQIPAMKVRAAAAATLFHRKLRQRSSKFARTSALPDRSARFTK